MVRRYTFMEKIVHNLFIFYFLSFTWGFITSFIGLLIMIPFLITKRFGVTQGRIYGIFPKSFGEGWGFEMGCFFFVASGCEKLKELHWHEMGHGVQNIIFGPFTILLVNIPSLIRYWYRESLYKHNKTPKTKYDDIWFEGQATKFGYKYFGEE